MICAVSHSSITEIMINPEINSTTSAFKFVLSEHLIKHINNNLSGNPAGLDVFRSWISSRGQFAGRMRYIDDEDIEKYFEINNEDDINVSCAYFAGHFIFDESQPKNTTYATYGIDMSSISAYKNYLGHGDNPILEIMLVDHGTETPASLCKYFKEETNVTFIDNYINNKSISLIKYFSVALREQATINVITKKNSLQKARNLYNEISSVRPDLVVNLFHFNNEKEFHDRHIVIGDRIHIRATSGLDAFSYHGVWVNREGTFSVYDIYDSTRTKTFDVVDNVGDISTLTVKLI